MIRRKSFFATIIFSLMLPFAAVAQENVKNSITIPTEEGIYSISFRSEGLIETKFKSADINSSEKKGSDSLLINLGADTENIKLRTVPVSDTLKISLDGLKMNIARDPFQIDYQFNQAWYNLNTGRRFVPGTSFLVSQADSLISQIVRGGALVPVVKEERDGLWQVHYFFETEEKEKNQEFCTEDFEGGTGEECIDISYNLSENEIAFTVSSVSEAPVIDEMELVLHGLENQIEFLWLNNLKYTPKNFLHEGKQIIPLRFDSPENEIRIELK